MWSRVWQVLNRCNEFNVTLIKFNVVKAKVKNVENFEKWMNPM